MRAATIFLLVLLTGCASSLEAQLDAAATRTGKVKAGTHLPAVPADCRKHEKHAALYEGADPVPALARERDAVDRGNSRTDRCAAYWDHAIAKLEGQLK